MTPERFSAVVSGVLIVGVVTSAVLMTIAVFGSLVVGWGGSLVGAPASDLSATDYSAIVPGLLALRPIAIAQAGLIVLVATPVVRVIASVIGFALERDRLYTAITLGVLTILLISLIGLR